MLNHLCPPQLPILAKKAAAPIQGVAAFFYSTKENCLPCKSRHSTISQHFKPLYERSCCVLPQTHYFRRALAKHPLPFVIRVEGQIVFSTETREVMI